MSFAVSDDSKATLLANQLAVAPFTTLEMGLFLNILTPSHLTHFADLTEPVFAGYARQTVTGWSAPVLSSSFVAVALAAQVVFANTDAVDSPPLYGWFYLDSTANKLVAAGRFETAFVLAATVGTVTFTPYWGRTGQ